MNTTVEYFVVGTGTETRVKFINVDEMPLNINVKYKWPDVEDKIYDGFLIISANEKNWLCQVG